MGYDRYGNYDGSNGYEGGPPEAGPQPPAGSLEALFNLQNANGGNAPTNYAEYGMVAPEQSSAGAVARPDFNWRDLNLRGKSIGAYDDQGMTKQLLNAQANNSLFTDGKTGKAITMDQQKQAYAAMDKDTFRDETGSAWGSIAGVVGMLAAAYFTGGASLAATGAVEGGAAAGAGVAAGEVGAGAYTAATAAELEAAGYSTAGMALTGEGGIGAASSVVGAGAGAAGYGTTAAELGTLAADSPYYSNEGLNYPTAESTYNSPINASVDPAAQTVDLSNNSMQDWLQKQVTSKVKNKLINAGINELTGSGQGGSGQGGSGQGGSDNTVQGSDLGGGQSTAGLSPAMQAYLQYAKKGTPDTGEGADTGPASAGGKTASVSSKTGKAGKTSDATKNSIADIARAELPDLGHYDEQIAQNKLTSGNIQGQWRNYELPQDTAPIAPTAIAAPVPYLAAPADYGSSGYT
jgi:hypothetical protein